MTDSESWERARRGVKPDLVGMKAIAAHLGVHRNTVTKWELDGLPVVSWGPGISAAYADRVRVWAAQRSHKRTRRAA